MKVDQTMSVFSTLKVLSEPQIEELHLAALEVLERTGVKVLNEEALELLKEGGADIVGDGRVLIPSALVKKALATAPERVTLCTRDGRQTVFLENSKVFFGTGSDCPTILDSFTGERRPFTKKDVGQAALLADALPNFDFFMSLGLVSDVPRFSSDRHQFEAMLLNTTMPIVFTAHDRAGMADIIEMASVAVGGEENLKKNPCICLYAEPITPLEHIEEALGKVLLGAEKRIPVVYTPCPMSGGTAPATLAGTIIVNVAENLSGLVIHQLKNPGAPFIGGGMTSIMDMATAVYSYGAPELSLLSAAMTQMMRFYKLPMFGTCGCSDSKVLDEQAAIEATFSTLMAALTGANLVHDIGFLESALLGSFEMMALTDEVIGMTKRIMRGIDINEETCALDIIHKVGPSGHFIGEKHTLENFKKEQYFPRFIDRQNFTNWSASGEKRMSERLNDGVKRILSEHKPPQLSDEQKTEIAAIVARADEQCAKNA